MLSFNLLTPSDIQRQLASDIKHARLHVKNWKRETLSEKSGVPVSTIKRFENSHEISLRQLLRLAHALGLLEQFDKLLITQTEGMSMDDYISQREKKTRVRGSK